MGVPTRRGSARDAEPAGLGTQGPAQTAAATFKPRQRIRPGPEVPGAGGREGGREERPCEQTPPRARALASWGLESQLGSRSPDGPGAGGGGGNLRGGGSGGDGRPWRRVCLSRGRSLGAGDRGGGMRFGGGGRHRDSPPSPQPPQPERSRRRGCPPPPRTSG